MILTLYDELIIIVGYFMFGVFNFSTYDIFCSFSLGKKKIAQIILMLIFIIFTVIIFYIYIYKVVYGYFSFFCFVFLFAGILFYYIYSRNIFNKKIKLISHNFSLYILPYIKKILKMIFQFLFPVGLYKFIFKKEYKKKY